VPRSARPWWPPSPCRRRPPSYSSCSGDAQPGPSGKARSRAVRGVPPPCVTGRACVRRGKPRPIARVLSGS
jgi:hypothetical protein